MPLNVFPFRLETCACHPPPWQQCILQWPDFLRRILVSHPWGSQTAPVTKIMARKTRPAYESQEHCVDQEICAWNHFEKDIVLQSTLSLVMNGFPTMHSINVWRSLTMLRSSETSASRILWVSMWGPPSTSSNLPWLQPLVETACISSPSQHWWKDGWKLRPGFGTKTSKSEFRKDYVRSNDVNRKWYAVNVKAFPGQGKNVIKPSTLLWLASVRRDAAIPRAGGGYASSWNWDGTFVEQSTLITCQFLIAKYLVSIPQNLTKTKHEMFSQRFRFSHQGPAVTSPSSGWLSAL